MLGSHRLTASRPLIRAPTAAANKVSFNNLVEAHVLQALRDRDDDALPFRLHPLHAGWPTADKPIAIDPRISFGRPTVAGSGVSTEALARRMDAGESVEDLAWDYGLEIAQIKYAIVYERAGAWCTSTKLTTPVDISVNSS